MFGRPFIGDLRGLSRQRLWECDQMTGATHQMEDDPPSSRIWFKIYIMKIIVPAHGILALPTEFAASVNSRSPRNFGRPPLFEQTDAVAK